MKFLWYTDTHFNLAWPWSKGVFIKNVQEEKPDGIFITGDISDGLNIIYDLKMLSNNIDCPIYFVLGNHDFHFRKYKDVENDVRELCKTRNNLFWMNDSGVIRLKDDVCLIGADGWYDAGIGNSNYIIFTADWFCIEEFRKLPDMKARINAFKDVAKISNDIIIANLKNALKEHKTIYLLTHVPPWREATRDEGSPFEEYWLPYNNNIDLGNSLEKLMVEHPEKKLIVLSGHTHTERWIHVSNNIECRVNKAKYTGLPRNEEHIII